MDRSEDTGELHVREGEMIFGAIAVGDWDEMERDSAGHVRWRLPAFASVEVFPPDSNTECFIVATDNKRGWGQDGDGLTICASVDRCDFDFRTKVFGLFPRGVRRHGNVRLKQNAWNTMEFALSEKRATYFINGKQVAKIELSSGELPSPTPFIGLYGFTTSYKARKFRMRSLRPQVMTIQPIWHELGQSQTLRAICCLSAVAGVEVCTLDAHELDEMQPTMQTLVGAVAARLGIPALLFGEGLENLQFVTPDSRLIPLNMLATPIQTMLNILAKGSESSYSNS